MLNSRIQFEKWTLCIGSTLLAEHSPERPFITAILREKEYTVSRGTVKEQITEAGRLPLPHVKAEGGSVSFSSKAHTVTVDLIEIDGGVKLELHGVEGWSYEFRLPAIEGEAVFGGGEQYRKTNLRGETVVNFVSEHIKAFTIIEKALLPRPLYAPKKHRQIGSYAPMPVFVTDRGRLFLFDTPSDGRSSFGDDAYRFEFDTCPKSLTLLKKERYESLCAYLNTVYPNRQYLPDWCHGGMILGVQGGTDIVLSKVFAMLDAGARVSGVWCQDWCGENRTVMGKQVWWNWETDEKLYPNLKDAIAKLNDRGVRFLAYINPYLVKDSRLYSYCLEQGWLITKKDGSVYHIKSTTFDAGMLDLTNPDAVRFIKDVLIRRNMLDLGISGWMADFGEYLPVDCVLHDGDPKELHNLWPVLWARVNREAVEEAGRKDILFFMRSGYLGIQTYAPVLWNGDQHTDTTKDYGMPCVMPASFSLGFSGVPMVHCDIGGFFSFGKMKRNEELFIRWMEMCAFSLLMRSHESIRPWANAQFDAPSVKPHTIRLTRIHAALAPYWKHCVGLASQGIPAMRPDFWDAVEYAESRDPYSYLLGEDLYVCPVIRRRSGMRSVWLPKGEWIGFWTGKEYPGDQRYRVSAPLGKLPVFYRKGSVYTELFRAAADDKNDGGNG